MSEQPPSITGFQVEQLVRADGYASWFGIGEIIAIDGDKALVKWDNDKYHHESWVKLDELTDVEGSRFP